GQVGGIGVVTVDHGGVSSTYQPVTPSVAAGDRVAAGDLLGRLVLHGSHCAPRSCLHLGRVIDTTYADPLALLPSASAAVRLMTPYGEPPSPPSAPSPGWTPGDGSL